MEPQKGKHGKCDDAENDSTNNDGHGRVNSLISFTNEEDDTIDNGGADRAHDPGNKAYKETIVPFADTIIDKGTMMVVNLYAVVASRTM